MDKKLIAICLLTLSAVGLMIANFVKPAAADTVVMNRDYTVLTAHIATGDDALYIVDNKTGLMAIFTYDPSTRSLRPRAVRPVVDALRTP